MHREHPAMSLSNKTMSHRTQFTYNIYFENELFEMNW